MTSTIVNNRDEDKNDAVLVSILKNADGVVFEEENGSFGGEVYVSPSHLLEVFTLLKNNSSLPFDSLCDLTCIDAKAHSSFLSNSEYRFVLIYQLLSIQNNYRLVIKVGVPHTLNEQGEMEYAVDSLTSLWASADFFEREVFDMFGVKFIGHPDLRRILIYDEFEGYPLRKDYPISKKQPRIPLLSPETRNTSFDMERKELDFIKNIREAREVPQPTLGIVQDNISKISENGIDTFMSPHVFDSPLHAESTIINIGPSHPATHGTVGIIAEVVGEEVVNADVEVGYLHRGFEKTAEECTYAQVIPYTDRLNYVSPLINNLGWCLAVENLLHITVPKRCAYIRVLMAEISRVCDHLTCIGASAMELGAYSVMLYLMQAREYLWELVEEVSGARLTASYFRIGGLNGDLPENFAEHAREAFPKVRRLIKFADRLLSKNRIFIGRMRDVACMSKEDAIAFGLTGPLLRACGVRYDIRKAFPYSCYDEFDFNIPVGEKGDNYDRYSVRMAEMEESLKIAEQALERMPEGAYKVVDREVSLPEKKEVYDTIEGMINHFKIITEGVKPPKGNIYFPVEGGNGEVGFYVVSDGSGHPYRVHVRAPSFLAMRAFKKLIIGCDIADVIATFGMMNMIGGECDR